MPKLTVATTFPLLPAHDGGRARVLGLYGAVASLGVDVDVVTFGPRNERPRTTVARPGLREIRIPQSAAHYAAELDLRAGRHTEPLTDIAFALFHRLTPDYAAAVRASASDASAVVAGHPYPGEVLAEAAPSRPLLYDAHDVETDLKAAIVPDPGLVAVVRERESRVCDRAEQVLVCADADGERFHRGFGVPRERLVTVANGYDGDRVRWVPWEQRAALRRRVGVDRFTALFVGSRHDPNVAAARAAIAAAAAVPSVRLLIVGGVGDLLDERSLPGNVDVLGVVPDGHLDAVLALADVALNPMSSGSGSNVKMLTYAAAGVPIVSSSFGLRGVGLTPDEHVVVAEPSELAVALEAVAGAPPDVTRDRVARAYAHVREWFEWRSIARRWLDHPPTRRWLDACG